MSHLRRNSATSDSQNYELSPQARREKLMEVLEQPIQPISPSFADAYRRFQPYPPNPTELEYVLRIGQNYCATPDLRYISRADERQMVMFCDGAYVKNGQGGRGGCGVVLSPPASQNPSPTACFEFPLENDGVAHTSNRAELRSAIIGLGLSNWRIEGFERVVVAMNSDYVVSGISERIHRWIEREWKTSAGTPVTNQDLWEMLLAKLREMETEGYHAQFWRVPREWNIADEYARRAASQKQTNTRYLHKRGKLPVYRIGVI